MSKRLFVMMSMCIMGLFTANSLFAEDVTVDGVDYTIAKKTKTAEVKGTTNEVNPQSWTQHLLFICEEEH